MVSLFTITGLCTLVVALVLLALVRMSANAQVAAERQLLTKLIVCVAVIALAMLAAGAYVDLYTRSVDLPHDPDFRLT